MTASFRNFSSCGLSSESGLPEKALLRHRNQPLSPREDSALNFACDRYDSFIRTTDPKHDAIVNEFFARVNEKGATPFPLSGPCPALSTGLTLCSFAEGDIYKKDYSGHYCVGCEAYLGDDEMETIDGVENCCSIHRKCATRPPPRSTAPRVASAGRAWPVRGQAKYFIFFMYFAWPVLHRPAELRREENYFFRLSKYQTALEEVPPPRDCLHPHAVSFLVDDRFERPRLQLHQGGAILAGRTLSAPDGASAPVARSACYLASARAQLFAEQPEFVQPSYRFNEVKKWVEAGNPHVS